MLGKKNPSRRVTQQPAAEAGPSPGTAVPGSDKPLPAQGCAAFWSWESLSLISSAIAQFSLEYFHWEMRDIK